MQRLVSNHKLIKGSAYLIVVLWGLFLCSACSRDTHDDRAEADRLNTISYTSRYKNLAICRSRAVDAYRLSEEAGYPFGMCEALCNQAFYCIARMEYAKSDSLLFEAENVAPDNVSNLAIEVLRMRLCQRRSQNKDFFLHKFHAERLIGRIENNLQPLNAHQLQLFSSVKAAYGIVLSTYLYYMGNEDESERVLHEVAPLPVYGETVSKSKRHRAADCHQADTAQWLAYLYNVGSYDCLVQCFMLSSSYDYPYWEANSLQSLSEYFMNEDNLRKVRKNNPASLRLLNEKDLPDSLISYDLAERALEIFVRYGDLYQSAAAWRTIADCHERNGDYEAMLNCLLASLSDTLVRQSPTIISSIDSRLSIAYSALDDKQMADACRNEYLDVQDSMRQDRQLEARAYEMHDKVVHLQVLVFAIFILVLLTGLVVLFQVRYLKKRKLSKRLQDLNDRLDETKEQVSMLELQLSDARRFNIEQRAKIQLIQTMQPLIDRMDHAIQHYDLADGGEYVSELCDTIEQGNQLLTKWIQLRKGSVKLRVETFAVQELFNIISLNSVSFASKGIALNVEPTDCNIKADRTLTLFLLNTIVDNARKFTADGGSVALSCCASADVEGYADVSVTDTGAGMTQEDADHLFEYRVIEDSQQEDLRQQQSHGFGLMNCRGIIDRYRKTSNLFSQAAIFAKSRVGEGTTITFRLPMVMKMLMVIVSLFASVSPYVNVASLHAANNATQTASNTTQTASHTERANAYADSMYYCNISGQYAECLQYADSVRHELNLYYLSQKDANPKDTLTALGENVEQKWWESGVRVDYDLLLAVRNESAVAALALHQWDVYRHNNEIYTSLYLLCTADATLNDYCAKMERYEGYSNLSLIILLMFSIAIVWSFYRYYLRDFVIAKRDYKHEIAQLEDHLQELRESHDRLYVANSISENCLSTIKHETMYYPSRISALISTCNNASNEEDNAQKTNKEREMLKETISYYKVLYGLLSEHCHRLLATNSISVDKMPLKDLLARCSNNIFADEVPESLSVIANMELMQYLFLLLKRKNRSAIKLQGYTTTADGMYIKLECLCDGISLTDEQIVQLFQVTTHDVDYLVIKQILREIGTLTFRHSCGVTAENTAEGLLVNITIPLAVYN